MAASRKGVFARNITSNMAGFAVAGIVALFLSPFVARELGLIKFGLWALLTSVTGYYGLLDLGVRSAVGQYVTRYWAKNDMVGVNRTMSTSMALLLGVAVIALILTFVLMWLLPGWIEAQNGRPDPDVPKLDPAALQVLISDAEIAMVISGVGIAIGIPMSIWATVTYALERFEVANAIGITERLIFAGLTILVLKMGGGIIGLAALTVGTQLLSSVVRMIVAYRMMPKLRLSLAGFARGSVCELTSYGLYNFMVNAADKIVLYMDNIIVGIFITLPAVGMYEIGAKLIPHYMNLALAVTWTMTPYATSCDAKGDTNALRVLLLKGTRGTVFLAAVVGAGLFLAGDEFIPIWMDDPKYESSVPVLLVLTCATFARASTSCGRQILFGMRRMKTLAALAFLEAGINISLSIVFVLEFGMIGIAYATLVSIALVYVLGQNILLVRIIAADGRRYAWQLMRAAVPVMGAMWLVSVWTDTWLIVDGWLPFALLVVLLLVPVIPIGYFMVMNPDERHLVRKRLPF